MITNDGTKTPLPSSYTYTTCSCVHRLPCGYCPLLNRPCPMQTVTPLGQTPVPTWRMNEFNSISAKDYPSTAGTISAECAADLEAKDG